MVHDIWTLFEARLQKCCLLCGFDERRHVQRYLRQSRWKDYGDYMRPATALVCSGSQLFPDQLPTCPISTDGDGGGLVNTTRPAHGSI